jgi:hypothetical protein
MYIDFQTGNKEYKLRLNTRATVTLEKTLGCNPLMIFGKGDRIPTITEMVTILHAALQPYHHSINMDAAYDIFDAYLEEHAATDFIAVIVEIYKASGIIREEQEQAEKN